MRHAPDHQVDQALSQLGQQNGVRPGLNPEPTGWTSAHELERGFRKDAAGHGRQHPDREARIAAPRIDGSRAFLEQLHSPQGMSAEHFAFRGKDDPSPFAFEQVGAEKGLQFCQGL